MKKIYIYAIASLLTFTACEDAIDLTPKSQLSESDYFKNETQLQLFSNTFYNNMLDKTPYDEQSDIFVANPLSSLVVNGTQRTVPGSGGGWTWTDLRKINTLLDHMHLCEDKAAVAKYTAVSRFFRAFFYFEKVKRFGDVPWYEHEMETNDAALYNPRDSREFVMQRMLEDVDYAIENLPSKSGESSAPYRLTKAAALALKAQFCLYEGTFRKYHNISFEGESYEYNGVKSNGNSAQFYLEQAANAAERVISGEVGSYKLYSTGNPQRDYQQLFLNENADVNEYILAIKFEMGLKIFHAANFKMIQPTQGNYGYTRKFINTYLMADGSRFTDKPGWQTMLFAEEMKDRDPRLAQTIRGLGYKREGETTVTPTELLKSVTGYKPIKFVLSAEATGQDRNDYNTNDLPVYRLAEIYLDFAEAKAELGTLTQADLDKSVNLIRKRAGMPNLYLAAANANPDTYLASAEYGYPNVTGSNQGVILEIRRERTIELTQENFRYDDIRRWKCGTACNQALTGMYFPGPGSYDLSGDGKANVVLYTSDQPKPTAAGCEVLEIGKDIHLTNGNSGYLNYFYAQTIFPFNEERDYLYPLPTDQLSINPNLKQNKGWE